MIKSVLRRVERLPFPILLFIISFFAYGLLIPFLGFYWDDLPNMWVFHMFGAGGFVSYASNHRPFSAWVFVLTTSILGESPIGYHILALLLRWAGSVATWWTLKQLWPAAKKQVAWVALLFAIYPGFRELPIATVFNVHLVCLALSIFSLGGMLWSMRHPRVFIPMTLASVVASATSIFTMEYFITLELLRPVLVWVVLREKRMDTWRVIKNLIINTAPYFLVLCAYALWRIYIFKFPYYEPVLMESSISFTERIRNVIPLIWNSITRSSILAWLSPFRGDNGTLMGRVMVVLFWLTATSSAFLSFLILRKVNEPKPEGQSFFSRWAFQAIILGIVALFLAGWPIWIAGLEVDLEPLDSRFTLPFLLGASLLVAGLIDLIPGKHVFKVAILSILVGASVGWHLKTTNVFRYEWEVFKDLFWQLTWRAPTVKPGTAFLTNDIPLQYYSDNSLTAMVNWTFAPEGKSLAMPYLLDFTSVRLGAGIPALEHGLKLTQDYSILSFTGSTDNTVAVFIMPPSCLRVLDQKLDDGYQRLPALTGKAANISNLGQIEFSNQATPPLNIFGHPPSQDWCYYYEKADQARQRQDWAAIVEYGEIAFGLNDNPNEATERLPFIEGYAHLGNWSRALELSNDTVVHGKNGVLTMLCNTWNRIMESTDESPEKEQAWQTVQSRYQCRAE